MKFVNKTWSSFCQWVQTLMADDETKETIWIITIAFGMIALTAVLLEASGLT